MTYSRMVASIIINTFGSEVGKWGGHGTHTPPGTPQKALLVEFRTPADYDKEDGYRYIDLLIYAECNYAGVYVRDRWSVWQNTEDDDSLGSVQENKGASEWRCLGYHDSCWTEGVERFLCDWKPADGEAPVGSVQGIFDRRLEGLGGLGRWYQIMEVDEKMRAELATARDDNYLRTAHEARTPDLTNRKPPLQ